MVQIAHSGDVDNRKGLQRDYLAAPFLFRLQRTPTPRRSGRHSCQWRLTADGRSIADEYWGPDRLTASHGRPCYCRPSIPRDDLACMQLYCRRSESTTQYEARMAVFCRAAPWRIEHDTLTARVQMGQSDLGSSIFCQPRAKELAYLHIKSPCSLPWSMALA